MITIVHQQRQTLIMDKFKKGSLKVYTQLKNEYQPELTQKMENFFNLENFETNSNEPTKKNVTSSLN
jgi:hypothetical protein